MKLNQFFVMALLAASSMVANFAKADFVIPQVLGQEFRVPDGQLLSTVRLLYSFNDGDREYNYLASAVRIGKFHYLTAAHVTSRLPVFSVNNPRKLDIGLNRLIPGRVGKVVDRYEVKVINKWAHPKYISGKQWDIAVFQIDKDIPNVPIVRIATQNVQSDDLFLVTGFPMRGKANFEDCQNLNRTTQVELEHCKARYYFNLSHWMKPIGYSEMLRLGFEREKRSFCIQSRFLPVERQWRVPLCEQLDFTLFESLRNSTKANRTNWCAGQKWDKCEEVTERASLEFTDSLPWENASTFLSIGSQNMLTDPNFPESRYAGMPRGVDLGGGHSGGAVYRLVGGQLEVVGVNAASRTISEDPKEDRASWNIFSNATEESTQLWLGRILQYNVR